jgi:protein-disulfide isomerase
MLDRRRFSAAALAFAAGFSLPAAAQTVPVAELAVPGPLGDVFVGRADAPVTIIEYASLTCGHCATFHEKVWPVLKQKYVETGKVRFVLREFPLDALSTAGFMLARCAGNDKFYPVTDLLFEQQKNWAYTDKPLENLGRFARQAGFTQESFEACLKNQSVYDAVVAVRKRGAETFKVDSTPTFFINGKMHRGALTVEELDKILTPLVGG